MLDFFVVVKSLLFRRLTTNLRNKHTRKRLYNAGDESSKLNLGLLPPTPVGDAAAINLMFHPEVERGRERERERERERKRERKSSQSEESQKERAVVMFWSTTKERHLCTAKQ